ncbi:hypothetical protein GH733_004354 [Mirounga leonina]|nr:hypothetical protein GH733_004354 [Mirounga leonina]
MTPCVLRAVECNGSPSVHTSWNCWPESHFCSNRTKKLTCPRRKTIGINVRINNIISTYFGRTGCPAFVDFSQCTYSSNRNCLEHCTHCRCGKPSVIWLTLARWHRHGHG